MKRHLLIPIATFVCLLAAGRLARGQDTNSAPPVLDYRYFQVIANQDMFDPSRRPHVIRTTTTVRPKRVDSFTLVGTMSYDKGQYAFFDSNSTQYRKTLKPSDTIAGYKIVEITTDYIKLAASSNRTINLPVGTGMRRQEGGVWKVAGSAEPQSDAPEPVSALLSPPVLAPGTTEVPASGPESEALKRLLLKRLQEK